MADEIYLVSFFGDAAHSILVEGFDEMAKTVADEMLGEKRPDEHEDITEQRAGWEETLRNGYNWKLVFHDGEEVFYHYSEMFEDCSIAITRVLEDRRKEVARG